MLAPPSRSAVLGVLSLALASCDRRARESTMVPGEPTRECLHSEGCCGGHTAGDASCGASTPADAPTDAAGDAPTRFAWVVPAGQFAEINVQLDGGATMTATFEADDAIAWNVHSHPGEVPTIHSKGRDEAGALAHTAQRAGLYSFLWANEGRGPVKLAVELRITGGGTLHSTHP